MEYYSENFKENHNLTMSNPNENTNQVESETHNFEHQKPPSKESAVTITTNSLDKNVVVMVEEKKDNEKNEDKQKAIKTVEVEEMAIAEEPISIEMLSKWLEEKNSAAIFTAIESGQISLVPSLSLNHIITKAKMAKAGQIAQAENDVMIHSLKAAAKSIEHILNNPQIFQPYLIQLPDGKVDIDKMKFAKDFGGMIFEKFGNNLSIPGMVKMMIPRGNPQLAYVWEGANLEAFKEVNFEGLMHILRSHDIALDKVDVFLKDLGLTPSPIVG